MSNERGLCAKEKESARSTSLASFTVSNEVHLHPILMITVASYYDRKPISIVQSPFRLSLTYYVAHSYFEAPDHCA